MWSWLEYLLYGPAPATTYDAMTQEVAAPSPGRSSMIFDSHIMSEAAGKSGKGPQAVSLSWDEARLYGGFSGAPTAWMGLTPRERKETLLAIFLANPWASNCIDTIGLYITSGGYTIEPRVENPNERQRDEIEEFLRRINNDWDFGQFVYDQITDEDIFGECFTEFTMKDGKPYQLFPIDCITMDTEHDRYGQVLKYKQQLSSTSRGIDLDPKTIVRWWNPHKRAKVDPFSPLERIQDAILLDKKMTNWTTTFFQKGAKFPFTIEGISDENEADRFLTWFMANYTGEKNAQKPFVGWGGAKAVPTGKGSIDIDFDKGLDRQQVIVLSAFHVPPSIACIAESGNRLTDMSDGQRKILQYIACDPRRHRFFEKFNYRLIYPFFGTDYYVSTRYADFRSDEELAKMQDIRIRNGSNTINETRQEMGKEAYEKGGDTALFAVSKEVVPVERLDEMADEQRDTAQVTLDTAKANADLAQTKAKQAKESPAPAPGQIGAANKTVPGQEKPAPAEKSQKDDAKQESDADRPDVVTHHTGMMIALLLDNDTAQRLAIPGGEPAEDLHITLCFMGDIDGPPSLNGSYTPYTMPGPIRRVLTAVASAARPLSGTLAGIGRFTTQVDDDTPTPITASVDVPGLTEFRTELVDALLQANYFVADNHGYTPHITLAYIDSDAEMPIESIEPLALHFNTVWLCVGDDRTPFKLGGIEPPPVGESNEEQETYSQGSTPDAVHTRQDQEESHRALHQIQATLTGYREEHAEGSEDTDSKAVLANWITQLFQGIKGRDAASYTLTEAEQSALAQKLAEANFAARGLAYNQAMAAAGLSTPVTEAGILNKFKDVLKWARDQVASIIKTMAEQFSNFLDHLAPDADVTSEANAWLDRYVAWKAEQIANATIGAGANEGSMEAIREMLKKAVEGIRVRVVPGESSSDVCQTYAGKDYGVEEYLALDIKFPVHPSCIHNIEVYKGGTA